MTVAPDPAEITPPTDPAVYGRPRGLGAGFWAVIALCVLSVAIGAAAMKFGPALWAKSREAPVAAAPAPADPLDMTVPAARLADSPAPANVAAPSAELSALQARVEALENGQDRTISAAAAALAAASLAEATQGSGSFETELAALERVLPLSGEVRSLRPYAESGAPSRASLAAEFDAAAARAAVAARAPGERAGLFARIGYALSAIVTIRRVGPGGDGPDAVLARAGAAAAAGDVEGALTLLRGLPPEAAQAMAPWRDRARQRVAVDRQVAAIRAQALADLMAVSRERP